MGRYYSGDIEGKFWFGVQSSYAFERFGATEREYYYWDDELEEEVLDEGGAEFVIDADDLHLVSDELKKLKKQIGSGVIKSLDNFFNEHSSYSAQKLATIGLDESVIIPYADYKLGQKIYEFMTRTNVTQSLEVYAEI